jgi:hypothetical protein
VKERICALICLSAAIAVAAGCGEETDRTAAAKLGEHTWQVEVAMTSGQRYRGLSGRSHLPDDRGMLFVYPEPQVLEFCMRGCDIPIDILFLDAEGTIVNMHAMAVEPDRLGRVDYSSHVPAQYALEIAGGSIRRKGIRIGQRVELIGTPAPEKAEP